MNKAIFFDRDGVLNLDTDLTTVFSDFVFYNNVHQTISNLRKCGYLIFIVTNQPAIARGLLTEEKLISLNTRYHSHFLSQDPDAIIDKILYCPHHPHANLEQYRTNCDCRKPKPGMLLKLAGDYNVDLSQSYMVGDRISDIIAGHLAGCKTVLILSGKHLDPPLQSDILGYKDLLNLKPDFTINKLEELEKIIICTGQ